MTIQVHLIHTCKIRGGFNPPHFWLRYKEVSENKLTNILMSRTLFGMQCMQSIVADGTHQTPPNSPLTQMSNRGTNDCIPRSNMHVFSFKCAQPGGDCLFYVANRYKPLATQVIHKVYNSMAITRPHCRRELLLVTALRPGSQGPPYLMRRSYAQ